MDELTHFMVLFVYIELCAKTILLSICQMMRIVANQKPICNVIRVLNLGLINRLNFRTRPAKSYEREWTQVISTHVLSRLFNILIWSPDSFDEGGVYHSRMLVNEGNDVGSEELVEEGKSDSMHRHLCSVHYHLLFVLKCLFVIR